MGDSKVQASRSVVCGKNNLSTVGGILKTQQVDILVCFDALIPSYNILYSLKVLKNETISAGT